ncbi:MAG: hypothetical protein BYD32DRAFT_400366 [Podila humilis]|nr:MAG: hypothetical protein BYD32DRAFT_400366 [Podila humilis]
MSSTTSKPTAPSSFKGIHHLKLASSSIQKTHDFYTKVFPFTPLPAHDHFTPDHKVFAKIISHPLTNLLVEIRYDPTRAASQKGWDPVTWAVGTRKDLEEWIQWLDSWNIKHSRILLGVKAWVLACEDPDGRHVRLYVTDEEHEWTDHPDQDPYWLGDIQADPAA